MNKSIRILLIIFVVLIAVYFLFFRSSERITTDKIDAKLFVADSSKIDKIEIVKTKETIVLEKINGQWMVTKPVNYPADTNAVYPMLRDLKNFVIESSASENPEKFNTYLDSVNNAHISTYQEGKLLGTFILGKGQSYGNSFIKKPDENRILLASPMVATNFTKPLKDYRHRLILTLNSFNINKIEFKSTDSNKVNFTAARDSVNKWRIDGDTIASGTMDGFLNTFSAMLTDDFIDSAVASFPEPTYTLTITENNGQKIVINLYREAGTTPPTYAVQVSGKQQLFRFNEPMANTLMKKKKDFIPEPPKK